MLAQPSTKVESMSPIIWNKMLAYCFGLVLMKYVKPYAENIIIYCMHYLRILAPHNLL